MTLQFGLNVKAKAENGPKLAEKPKKASIFDDDFDDEPEEAGDDVAEVEAITEFDASAPVKRSNLSTSARPTQKSKAKPPSRPPAPKSALPAIDFTDASADRASEKHAKAATSLDPSIYDYDSFHDVHTTVSQAKKEAERQDALERKPRYINNLLDAANRRKQDQLVAREKLLQKEREAEGDEFADKGKFVTEAYKAQQEEARQIEEQEKLKAEEEEQRRRKLGGGMQSFYRGVIDDTNRRHEEAMEAARKLEAGPKIDIESSKERTDADLAAEMKTKGVNVQLNEEGQITDKRQLLSAGLNVAPAVKGSGKGSADHLRTQNKPAQQAFAGKRNDQRAMRERQTKMMEEQLAEATKRAADEEADELRKREHAAKSKKTDADISSAKERYLARKREAEAAKKAG